MNDSFAGSYLGKLRATVGSDLVLMPGAMVALINHSGRVLFTRRADSGDWCLPAGAAESGGSFAETAVTEVLEEVGVAVDPTALEAFGALSDAASHTVEYPNGDLTHCFALLLLAREWEGVPAAASDETLEVRFAAPSAPPLPMMRPAAVATDLLVEYLRTNRFQLH